MRIWPRRRFGPLGDLLQGRRGGELGPRAAAASARPQGASKAPALGDRAPDDRARLPGERQRHLGPPAGAPGQRAVEGAQALVHRPRAVDHPRGDGAGEHPRAGAGARARAGRVGGKAKVGGIAHVCLEHGGIDAGGAGHKAPPARGRLADQGSADLLDHLGSEASDELSDRRLVRHPLGQRDQAEAAQVQRVRDLAHERLIAPARALLDEHQAHEAIHRDRRPPAPCRRPIPGARDRLEERRARKQSIERRQVTRQLAHLDRQPEVEQRLQLPTRQTKHPPLQITRFAGSILTLASDSMAPSAAPISGASD